MALTGTITKTRKDIEKALADTGALNAAVGAGDLAVKKLREARADLSARAAALDPQALKSSAQATVVAAPEHVKALPTKAQAAVGELVTGALTAYGDLAGRGKTLVTRVRRQQATKDLKTQASATASSAKATATTAKKSAGATKTAAKSASTTAKKSAARTKTSAKSTSTRARKTASAGKKAARATSKKVGQ